MSESERAVVLTAEEREALGSIVMRYENEDQSLTDWHACEGCPSLSQKSCACSGRPWLCDEMATAVERIVAVRVAAALHPVEEVLAAAESGADAWGACTHEWLRINNLRAAIRADS